MEKITAITYWYFFKDKQPEPDSCIMVYWLPTDNKSNDREVSLDLKYFEGALYDANGNDLDVDLTGENVIWAYWPNF